MEEGNRSADEINGKLRCLQDKWYNKLNETYRSEKFSSPFCFGISEETVEECNNGKKLLMYVGEEARNWRFDRPIDIEYIQKYAIAYFDNQFSDLSKERVAGFNTEDQKALQKWNNSAFWSFLRVIKDPQVAVCWNNLDKLHRITQNRETKPLTYQQERELHTAFGDDQLPLLWQEIDLVRPDYIILMGPKYNRSIEWAFGLPEKTLEEPLGKDPCKVVDLTDRFKKVFSSEHQPEVFWICHPGWLQRNNVYDPVLAKLKKHLCLKKQNKPL